MRREKLRPYSPVYPAFTWIRAAVELAQIGQAAHGQSMRVLFAGFEQRGDVFRHLFPRLGAGGGGAVRQQVIGLHDAIDRGFH